MAVKRLVKQRQAKLTDPQSSVTIRRVSSMTPVMDPCTGSMLQYIYQLCTVKFFEHIR